MTEPDAQPRAWRRFLVRWVVGVAAGRPDGGDPAPTATPTSSPAGTATGTPTGTLAGGLAGTATGTDAATPTDADGTGPSGTDTATPTDTDGTGPSGAPAATAAAGGGSPGRPSWPGPLWAFRTGVAGTLGVAVTLVLVRVLGDAGSVLTLLLVSLVIALGLDPLVTFLVGRGVGRRLAVTLVVLGFLLVVAGFFAAVVPPVATQGQQLVANAPDYVRRLQDHSSLLGRLNDRYQLLERIQRYASSSGDVLFSDILRLGAAVLGAVTSALTVLVLTIYFLANLPGIKRTMLRTLPRSRRPRASAMTDEIVRRVGGYVLGNVLTSVVAGLGTFVFLEIVGVPYPLALALFVAVFDLIPIVGSTIAGAVVTLVALTVSTPVAIVTLLYYVAYRLAEDYLLVPRVMRSTVKVPAVVTIVALLLGGSLFGIVGALLAIPAAAVVHLMMAELVWPKLDRA